jgi:NADPH:quinone reductase-like Zn-dependent oxidoreductase
VLGIAAVLSFAASPLLMADTHPVPDTMLAAALDAGGGPEVLSIHHLPVPKPKEGEVLIAVHATGVNVWDVGFRQNPGDRARFPLVLGSDGRHDGRGRVAYLYGLEPLPKPRFGMQMTLYSFVSGSGAFERLNQAAEAARLQVPIAAEYPLAAAADAHRRLEAGHLVGKIVLRVQ